MGSDIDKFLLKGTDNNKFEADTNKLEADNDKTKLPHINNMVDFCHNWTNNGIACSPCLLLVSIIRTTCLF